MYLHFWPIYALCPLCTLLDDAWAPAIWQTFFTSTLGLEVPVLSSLPRHHNLPAAKCGCKKFLLDTHGDHISTCTAHALHKTELVYKNLAKSRKLAPFWCSYPLRHNPTGEVEK